MTPEELNAYWTRQFPECPPVGYLLKHLYKDRCARFCALDNGRSYPETEADSRALCERLNALLEHLFESEARIVLITTMPSELETPPRDAPGFLNFDPEGRFLHSLGMHEFELEFATPSYWHLFMSSRDYTYGVLDSVLRASSEYPAQSGVLNTIVLGPATRRLFYVYPGGCDVVMESALKRDQLADRFADWSVR